MASEDLSPPADVSEQDYQRIRQELVRAVRRICPPWLAADSEDLVQNAVIRVLRIHRRHETGGELQASYLWRTAHSAVIDEIRRRQRRQEVPLVDVTEVPSESGPGPDRRYAGGQLSRALRECLKRLTPPRRSAVTLHLHGHQVSQVARLTGWNVKRTKNLTYRGLDDLRDCLRAKGIDRDFE